MEELNELNELIDQLSYDGYVLRVEGDFPHKTVTLFYDKWELKKQIELTPSNFFNELYLCNEIRNLRNELDDLIVKEES